ncbi:hypothetical protein [Chamaesiphon sp. VAR_48_metabat_403]|uniref:hypothetical protein n=1 Tax=Chamaesiphon sp. VAR_48_metabat_403 TaxID=2964700 RepID=UPI00286D7E9B|nr:hypothetical protein [Chamaesiphon sp. VAR_48_metabat_403]
MNYLPRPKSDGRSIGLVGLAIGVSIALNSCGNSSTADRKSSTADLASAITCGDG